MHSRDRLQGGGGLIPAFAAPLEVILTIYLVTECL
jgi:hypothetical protein